MIKPKKVFFMAVDGVAPRAKMNQQRARRFRAGRDRMKKLKTIAEKTGQTLKETIAQHFDTNAITPGISTEYFPFLRYEQIVSSVFKRNVSLKRYIHRCMNIFILYKIAYEYSL